jgi:nucleoid DNA-binding protein
MDMAKKKSAKKGSKKAPAIKNRYSKTQVIGDVAEKTGLSKKQVGGVIEELGCVIERHVRKGAAGEFVLPGMLKIKTVKKPATKARKGINPFTGEEMMFKAKPATVKVKILPLKALKEMVL